TDRDNTARVSRPDTVLGPGRSRAQAGSLPSVLQPVSLSHRTGRAHAGSKERCTFASDRMPRFVSLAPTLRRPLSDPGCRLNWNSPHTGSDDVHVHQSINFCRGSLVGSHRTL